MSTTSKYLKKIRKERNLTQTEIANQVGVSQVLVNSWENGSRQLTIKNAIRLEHILGLEFGEIIDHLIEDALVEEYDFIEKDPKAIAN